MKSWRNHTIFYCIIVMMISLFTARLALTASIILFTVLCFFHNDIKGHIKNFFSSPLLWSMSLLFLLPLISGLWSEDKKIWLDIVRIKLPLLALPLAIAGPFNFSQKQWQWLASVFILLVVAGTAWSMFHYIPNMDAVNEGYLRAKTMTTPLQNDHVRFSWLVSIAILFAGWLWTQNKDQKTISWLLMLATMWLILFLHILAARTGLLCFYIILLGTVIWIISKKVKPVYRAGLLLLLVALPVTAWFVLPTFRNKIKYFRYDFEYVRDAHYLPGGNDATRVISLKAGWNIMKEEAMKGTGFGDIFHETSKWYAANYPRMQEHEKILPSSEWLIYGAGTGVPGLLIFTFVVLTPFFIRVKNKVLWWLLNCLVAFSFLFDIGLEVQFGVFIYPFIVLLSWKAMVYFNKGLIATLGKK
jgi:O-antigen ligase